MTINEVLGKEIELGTYIIGFQNEGRDDETFFFVENINDLQELWQDFCEGNNLSLDCVDYVYIEQSGVSILSEYLEETGATLYVYNGWCIETEKGRERFASWEDMIRWMDDQNYERRR